MSHVAAYYNRYWKKRLESGPAPLPPIRSSIPGALVRFSQYGACLQQVPDRSRLLDIGCGEGNVTELYRIRKGCETHGIELSDLAIERAVARGVQPAKWDLNEYPYPFADASFDVATMVDVVEHVINPLALLRESRRILKDGGRAVVCVPNFARLGNRARLLFRGDPRDILHWGGYGDGMEHLHWFTQPKLKAFMQEAGFRDIRFHPIGLPTGFFFGVAGRPNLASWLLATGVKERQ